MDSIRALRAPFSSLITRSDSLVRWDKFSHFLLGPGPDRLARAMPRGPGDHLPLAGGAGRRVRGRIASPSR